MNKVKIVFADIDWTLLNHAKKPAEFDLNSIFALKKAQQNGVLVFLSTARSYHSIEQVGILDLFSPDGIIALNGGEIVFKDKIIHRIKVEDNLFSRLCERANKFNINVQGIRLFDSFLINPSFENVQYMFRTYPENIPDIEPYQNQDVLGAVLFANENEEEFFIDLLREFKYCRRVHPYSLFLSSEYFDKGVATKITLDYLKIKKEESAAVGDDIQDIPMFKEVEYSFAMGNAHDEYKKEAIFITKSIDESGVKVALEQLNLI